jgi:hypothetical protein
VRVGQVDLDLSADWHVGDPRWDVAVVGDRDRMGRTKVREGEPEFFGGFDRQHRVCGAGVKRAGEHGDGTALCLDVKVQEGHIATLVFEAPAGQRTGGLAGDVLGGGHLVDPEPAAFGAERLKKLLLGVCNGDDSATVRGNPLSAVMLELGDQAPAIDAVLRVDLGDSAGGHREEIDHGTDCSGTTCAQPTACLARR